MHKVLCSILIAAGTLLLTNTVVANDAEIQQIKDQLKASVPDLQVNDVRPSPLAGWYEVTLGAKLIYVSPDGRYVFDGTLMDIKNSVNLTEKPRIAARAAALKSLGDKVIEFAPATSTEHVLYVFTDVDCTYCRKFHSEINKLTDAGIAVRYMAFPRAGIPSHTYDTMVSVWCSADRKQALTDAKAGKEIKVAVCDNPVKQEFDLGRTMGVKGTPTVLNEDGQELGGYIPAEELIKLFKGNAS